VSGGGLAGLTVQAARRALAARFRDEGLDSPDLDVRLLVGAALRLDLTGLAVQAERRITPDEAATIEGFAQRRIAREPVSRILGRKEFWGLDLLLSEATLVPRADTETVVEAALDLIRHEQRVTDALLIADIGTGSGAILLALLTELPNAGGIGTDISAEALATAEENARRLGLAGRAAFVRCDYAAALAGPLDLIVANPPYIATADIAGLERDVRTHDPHRALDGGPDGLDAYRILVPQAARLLAPGGALVVEVGRGQSAAVGAIMDAAGLALPSPPRADLGGVPRAVVGRKPRR
jgi:release factor glutamine methyltransferase